MTKIDAATRPTLLTDGTQVAQPSDPTGLAALFEGMIAQATDVSDEVGGAKPGAIDSMVPQAAAAQAVGPAEGSDLPVEPTEVPAHAVAEQLLKALASSVGGSTAARIRPGRGSDTPEASTKDKKARQTDEESIEAASDPKATTLPPPVAPAPSAQTPSLIDAPDRESTIAQSPVQLSDALQSVGKSTERPAAVLSGRALPPAVSDPQRPAPSGIQAKEQPDLQKAKGSDTLLRLVQQLAPAPARDIDRALVRKADDVADPLVPAAPVHAASAGASPDAALTPPAPLTAAAPQAAAAAPSERLSDHVERHLEVAKDGAWLDQLARDIAQAGGEDGTSLRFKLHPAHLGSMHVEIARDAQGTSVRLTADTETGRALLADAQPKLIQEARAQGLRLSEAHVDLGNGGQGTHQRHTPAEPQIKTARLLHREEERDGKPTSGRAERYA